MKNGFTVCLVGRPNVGKSSLFNKLTGSRRAIVDDYAGVTRDRMFGRADLEGTSAWLIDTGGFEPAAEDIIFTQVREQAELAMEEADIICFVVDGREGLTPIDRDLAEMMRRSGKPIVVAVNKIDHPANQENLADFHQLGFSAVLPISAEHSLGLGELCDVLSEGRPNDLYAEEPEPEGEAPPRIAVVGCPNVGKSSLVNKLLGEKRMAVANIPGTTRDSIDTEVKWHGKRYIFTDTAGIRKKKRISQKLEKYSAIMALKSIAAAEMVLLVLDATEGVRDQDARIAGIIRDEGRACIILVNKWDLVEKDNLSTEHFKEELYTKLKFLSHAPVQFISAETGQRVPKIYEMIEEVSAEYRKRVDTGPLNRRVADWAARKLPPIYKGRRSKIYYVSQTRTAPPIFNFVVNQSEGFNEQYKRYITNRIREEFGFTGSPVICRFTARKRNE